MTRETAFPHTEDAQGVTEIVRGVIEETMRDPGADNTTGHEIQEKDVQDQLLLPAIDEIHHTLTQKETEAKQHAIPSDRESSHGEKNRIGIPYQIHAL
jgi:hypothetical protein